jgi:hypothetical protein
MAIVAADERANARVTTRLANALIAESSADKLESDLPRTHR